MLKTILKLWLKSRKLTEDDKSIMKAFGIEDKKVFRRIKLIRDLMMYELVGANKESYEYILLTIKADIFACIIKSNPEYDAEMFRQLWNRMIVCEHAQFESFMKEYNQQLLGRDYKEWGIEQTRIAEFEEMKASDFDTTH